MGRMFFREGSKKPLACGASELVKGQIFAEFIVLAFGISVKIFEVPVLDEVGDRSYHEWLLEPGRGDPGIEREVKTWTDVQKRNQGVTGLGN